MKRSLKKSLVLILTMFMVVGFSSLAAASPMVFLELVGDTPDPGAFYTEVNIGDTFDVQVYININADDYLPAYLQGVMVGINETTTLLDFTSLTDAKFPINGGWTVSNCALNDTDGNDASFSNEMYSLGRPNGNLLLGTIHLTALSNAGLADLVTGLKFYLPCVNNINLDTGDSLDSEFEFFGGQVNVVPIPGALVLLGSGLIGLIGLGRRRMKRS